MDDKTLHILEYFTVLDRVAGYCDFFVSEEKVRDLQPTTDVDTARQWQEQTSEAVALLASHPEFSIGGARDVRPFIDLARHGGVLAPHELLDIKYTLVSARVLERKLERLADQFPRLADIAAQFPPPSGIVDAVSRAISDHGDILDSASEQLSAIRRDLRIVHDRLLTKLQKMVTDPEKAPFLQETLITQRDGRYVLPLRAEFKGRIRAIVHDQSSSGATLFIEPLNVVDLNNEYRELQLKERDEERRILAELSLMVADHHHDLLQVVEIIAELDFTLARAKYALEIDAKEPVLHAIKPTKSKHPGTIIRLYEARHPLLDPKAVVPIDLELPADTYALVITGPNTGGKTVTLKTVGLLALMAQSGLHIPTQSGSEISLYKQIYADIGDEQSIEQSLSTFSGHITNIIRILERADGKSLVLLDELGAGTDPQEGAALARALLDHILERGLTTLVTTHHPELKAYAHARPGVGNASVEFDLETLRPTFRLIIGLPGRSNALAIAERLGLPKEIVESARAEVNPDDLRADHLLDEIHKQRELARHARQEAENVRQEIQSLRQDLVERLDKIEDERREILEEAHKEMQARIEEIQVETARLRKELQRAQQPLEVLQVIEEGVEELAELDFPELYEPPPLAFPERKSVRLGDKVRLHSLNTQGIVTSLGEEEAEVQVGNLRVRARMRDLELVGLDEVQGRISDIESGVRAVSRKDQKTSHQVGEGLSSSPGMEINLRGLRADEAVVSLERYLDAAYLAGLPFVRIIHGKGTGKLRQVVREVLSQHPQVSSFSPGEQNEGGDGVTVAKLVV